MAMANAKCKCKTCGKEFVFRKDCWNRTDANSFEEWAADHIDECPECRRARIAKERDEKAASLIAKYNLPEITGVSDRQIAYANDLRRKWLAKDGSDADLERFAKIKDQMSAPGFDAKLKKLADDKYDGDIQKTTENLFARYYVTVANVISSETNASKIIDILKNEIL